jgi:hypothetical protein
MLEDKDMAESKRRRISIFAKGKTLERFKPSIVPPPSSENTPNPHVLNTKHFKKEIEGLLEGYGGHYKLDFGYEDDLKFNDNKQWGSILDYV